jgi:hypothetical protein
MSKRSMSDATAKTIAIGGLVLMGLIATAPIGGAVWGSTIMIGTVAMDPFIWATVGLGSIGVLFSKGKDK